MFNPNNASGVFIHPEIRNEVIKEYSRLLHNNPQADGALMWSMARDYCRSIAQADTAIMKANIW